ncbi:hypothetical protein [Rhodoferax sp.]|uniref:hypothetical protein n=1 Tax=Rhodoferax sp. TaxID=50421 RepID=UPI002ACD9CDF|nr:hypothetical protein [Rhodoferax sp.]MDZ7918806.1 hypothetical protein [Rhodoferax sp.]
MSPKNEEISSSLLKGLHLQVPLLHGMTYRLRHGQDWSHANSRTLQIDSQWPIACNSSQHVTAVRE